MQLNSTDIFKFDNTTHRHARFGYGPLLGLLLANLLSNSAVAKFNPLGALKISYEPVPFTTYNQPPPDNHNYWQPLQNSYAPPTASISDATEAQHIHHHHHISSIPNQQQIVSINGGRPPTEIIIDGDYDGTDTGNSDTTEDNTLSTVIEEDSYLESLKTNIETPRLVEPIAEESRLVPVGQNTLRVKKSVKRGVGRYSNNKRNKYNVQNRRRYTTTPEYYEYDSYEDLTTKYRQRNKPKRPIDSYEDSTEEYEYDDEYEFTTKPYKKRRRTTTAKPKRSKTKTKNKKKPQKVVDYEDDDEVMEPLTQIIEIRPRQEITTLETEVTDGTTTTTAASTTSTTTTASTNNTGYGYGPSNGNENISITYGPPLGGFQGVYGPPNQAYGPPKPAYGPPLTGNGQFQGSLDSSPNAFVRQIHDIFEFDNVFHR